MYRDSIDNEETRKKTIQTQMTYDFEKKEAVANAEYKKEIEKQAIIADEKSRKQKLIIGFVGVGLVLVLVFAGFMYSMLRLTLKQKKWIEIKNIETEEQKHYRQHHLCKTHTTSHVAPPQRYMGGFAKILCAI